MPAHILTRLFKYEQNGGMTFHALGVDVGSTNTKVALIALEPDGTVRELSLHSVPTSDDIPELLDALQNAVRHVLQVSAVMPDVIGIASMAETGVPLAGDDAPLTPLLRWNGRRHGGDVDALVDRFGASELFVATGVPATAKAPLATWRWLRRTRPALFGRMARWAGAAELVCLALTGELVTDHTLAARSMAYRLPGAGEALPTEFDGTLLAAAGLDPGRLPAVARPGATAGSVTADAARRTGLRAGTPVIVAGHDHAVGAWAAGAREPGDVADSLGTAEALFRVLGTGAHGAETDRRAVGAAGMSFGRTVTGERESLIAGMAGSGSLIRWWFDTLLGGADPAAVYAAVDALEPGPGGVLVLPYPSGRQSPAPDASARLRILDAHRRLLDPASRSQAELTRGLLEALSLQLRWMDAEQRRLSGDDTVPTIRVLGGIGAANRTWLRIKAAVMPAPLALTTATEPVASGAALLAAVRLGLVGADAVLPHTDVAADPRTGTPGGRDYDGAYRDFVSAASDAAAMTPAP